VIRNPVYRRIGFLGFGLLTLIGCSDPLVLKEEFKLDEDGFMRCTLEQQDQGDEAVFICIFTYLPPDRKTEEVITTRVARCGKPKIRIEWGCEEGRLIILIKGCSEEGLLFQRTGPNQWENLALIDKNGQDLAPFIYELF
jgi:hypothetical protein